MADNTTAPAPKKRFRWLRILLWCALTVVVLLVIGFFVVTSNAFVKGFILPKVSQSMNAKVTADNVGVHLSSVDLKNFKVQTTGTEPLVSAQEVRLRYGLMDIIGGRITVDEIFLQSPTIELVQNADGTSNLDPITKKEAKAGQPAQPSQPPKVEKPAPQAPPSAPPKPSKPTELNVKKIDIVNATVRIIKHYEGGFKDVTTVPGFNFSAQNIANGQTGSIKISSGLSMENNPPAPGTNASLLAKIAGEFTFALARDLAPESVKGTLGVDVEKASGGLSDASGLNTTFNCDVTPSEIKEIALRAKKGGATLAEVLVNGPFSIAQKEGVLKVQLLGLDRNLLNLVGAKSGMDFGQTKINSTSQVTITNQGKVITLAGQLNANQFSVTRTNQSTPPLDLGVAYNVTVDQPAQSALIKEFNLKGVQNQRQILSGDLSNPMRVAWSSNAPPAGDATLNLKITGFDLAEWKAFVGTIAPAGKVDLAVKLLSQQGGNLLTLDFSSQVEGLTAVMGSNNVSQLGATLLTKAQITDLKKVVLNDLRAQLTQQGQTLVTANGSGLVDTGTTNTDLSLGVQGSLARLLQMMPQTNLNVTAGNIDLKVHVVQKQAAQSVTGNFGLTNFTGKAGGSEFANYAVGTDFDVAMNGDVIEIRKTAGTLQSGGNPGGSFDVSGKAEMEKRGDKKELKAAQFALKLANLNENGLRPFLQAALGDKRLMSVLVNATANANYNPQSDSTIKADFAMSKLVVNDPKGQIPQTPLEAKLQLDSGLAKQVVDLRKLTVTLTPTDRAKNEVTLSGKVDMSDTNATQGNLKLLADSLDLTTYYDLFGSKSGTQTAAAKPAPAQPAPAPAPAKTPAPGQPAPGAGAPAGTASANKPLPFRNFSFEANIGRIFLREIAISNLQTLVKLDPQKVLLQPFQLVMNGAPLKSSVDLDLSVPGYKYDVAFSADRLPIKPLVDTFVPERKGMLSGEIVSDVKVQGVGSTGASLQKTLNGQVQFALTNANVDVLDPMFQKYLGPLAKFLQPIATFLNVPELVKSPIQQINLGSQMGQGNIQVQTLNVISPAFSLDTAGTLPIAEVLTNSPFNNWPVNFYLSKNLGQKIGFVPSGTPADAKYVKLPNFLSVAGTVGSPDARINKTALAGTLLEKYLPKIPGIGDKGGSLLQGLGGILPGGSSTNQTTTSTNAPKGGLLQGLGGLLGKQPATTNAPVTQTNQPRKLNPFDLFKK